MTSRKKIVIVGSSGHATSVLDTLSYLDCYSLAGLLDRFREPGASNGGGHEILGGELDIIQLRRQEGIGSAAVAIGDNWTRAQSVKVLLQQAPDLDFATLIHPSAVVSPSAVVGCGTVIMAGAVVNANARIGEFAIVNTRASVDHDCVIGDYASLAPGATLGGGVTVGEFSAICLGSNVIHRCSIGRHTVVGAGATVLGDLPDCVVAYGTPARVIRRREIGEPYM